MTYTEIYEPQEDSYLLQQVLRERKADLSGTSLDMGTGSGILAETLSDNPQITSVYACDVNQYAIERLSEKARSTTQKIIPHHSDLFEVFETTGQSILFDTIVFNPPYLPDEAGEDQETKRIVAGGPQGHELTISFLKGLKTYLSPQGVCFIIVSSLARQDLIDTFLFEHGFEYSIVAEQSLFFETLFVYRIRHHSGLVHIQEELNVPLESFSYLTHGKKGIIFTFPYQKTTASAKVYHFLHPDYPPKRPYLHHEGKILEQLNIYGIGPTLIWYTSDSLVYEFCTGQLIGSVLEEESLSLSRQQTILILVLLKCYLLDQLRISKFELTNPRKHILISFDESDEQMTPISIDSLSLSDNPQEIAATIRSIEKQQRCDVTFLDFERAREQDAPKNVTQVVQYLLYGKGTLLLSGKTNEKYEQMKASLQEYHRTYSIASFRSILNQLF